MMIMMMKNEKGIITRRGCVRHELILNYKQSKWKIIQKTKQKKKKQKQKKNKNKDKKILKFF